MFGVAVTGMLIFVVGHKMKTIQSKIALKVRRRSLVPDKDYLINTLPSLASLASENKLANSSTNNK